MAPPDIVLVGHLAQDLQPDGSYRLGGTVTYAGLLAVRLGLQVGVLTSAPPDDIAQLQALLPGAEITAVSATTPTIFENRYHAGQRTQHLRARATELGAKDFPASWQAAPLILFGPIAGEVTSNLVATARHSIRAATPQGWLRRWGADGRVTPQAWEAASVLLPYLTVLILSTEDLAIAAGAGDLSATLDAWAQTVPHVVLTDGPRPARVWSAGHELPPVPAQPAHEVDPTGAGDCFALALLAHLWRTGNLVESVRFAHAAASYVIEAPGTAGIPTAEQIAARLG